MRFVKIHECAQLVRGSIDPRRHADEQFVLYSIPGYDAGSPEFVRGSDIGSSKTLVSPGDVLFSKLNPRIPRVWVVATGHHLRQICSTEFLPLRPRCNDHLDSYFLRYMCLAPQFLQPIQREVSSSTKSHQRIRPEVLLNGQIPHPPLSEQRRIVARIQECLARVEEIENLEAECAEEASVLSTSLINAFADPSWPKATLGDLCREIRNGWSGKEAANGVNAQVLKLSCVHKLVVDLQETKAAAVSRDVLDEFSIKQSDVFVVRGNGSLHLVGRSAVVETACKGVIFNDLLIRLRFKPGVEAEFVNLILHIPIVRQQIESFAKTAAGIWKINQSNLARVEIPFPDRDHQAAFVRKVKNGIAICAALRTTSKGIPVIQLRDSVLRHAFAGEL